jgi:hypothetical protein
MLEFSASNVVTKVTLINKIRMVRYSILNRYFWNIKRVHFIYRSVNLEKCASIKIQILTLKLITNKNMRQVMKIWDKILYSMRIISLYRTIMILLS